MSTTNIVLTPQKVMKPNKHQEGQVYIRVAQKEAKVLYSDVAEDSRCISSKRVEIAVENMDFVAICNAEALAVVFVAPGSVAVIDADGKQVYAPTLRQAYFRYKKSI